jgi:hypothetical protein
MENKVIKVINKFQYLGSIATYGNNIDVESMHTIMMGNILYWMLQNLLGLKLLRKYTKYKIHENLIKLVVLMVLTLHKLSTEYGIEAYFLNWGQLFPIISIYYWNLI